MNYQPSSDDMTLMLLDPKEYRSASASFQRLVDKCLEDGSITRSESIMLVQKHNDLQKKSRIALKKLLEIHNQYPASTLIMDKGIIASRGRVSKNLTPEVQKLDTVHNKETLKERLLSPFGDEKVRFALVTVPAAFFSLLKFTGVL